MSTRLLDSAHRLYRVADLDALVKQLSRHNSTRANLRLVKPFDDAAFVAEVEARLKALDDRTARSTLGYIEIGRMLLDRKERGKQDGSIPHGEWVPWLKKKFPKAVQRLQEYMRVAKFLDTADTEAKNRVLVFCHQGFHAVLQQVQSEERLSKRKPKPAPLLDDVEGEKLRILVGDCMLRLKEIPDASIDCVITSPPYYRTLIY